VPTLYGYALLGNIRLGCKYLRGTNTLAYFGRRKKFFKPWLGKAEGDGHNEPQNLGEFSQQFQEQIL